MRYESLILDIDGTLWDSRALVAEGYNIQLRAEGLDHLCTDAETLKTLFGKVMTEIADNLFPDFPPEVRYPLRAQARLARSFRARSVLSDRCGSPLPRPYRKSRMSHASEEYRKAAPQSGG